MRRQILHKTVMKLISIESGGKKLNEDYSAHNKYPTFKATECPMNARYLYLFFNPQVRVFKNEVHHKMQREKLYKLH